MRRDFSEEYKQKLIGMIRENESEKWFELTDQIGDYFLEFGDWIGALGLYKFFAGVDSYTKAILDKNDTTVEQLNKIFDDVYKEDERFASRIRGDISGSFQDYAQLLFQMQATVTTSGFNKEAIGGLIGFLDNVKNNLKKIEYDVHFDKTVYDIVYDKDGRKRKVEEISNSDKDKVIKAFEKVHPDWKEDLDRILATGEPNTLSEDDIRNIKYIAYTAEEPYRSIYLDNVKKYEIGTIGDPDNEGAFYYPSTNKIYFENGDDGFEDDPRGAYTTFFHESGHAIDYNNGSPFSLGNIFYDDETGNLIMLQEAIERDVYNNIESQIREYVSDEEAVQAILDAFRYGNDPEELPPDQRAIYEQVVSDYDRALFGEENEAASDVYGGVTNLKIDAGYGHRPGDNQTIDEYTYWYDSDGNATGSQSKELWAEYFSYCMTGDEEALESLRKYFPEASKILDQMAEQLGKYVGQ